MTDPSHDVFVDEEDVVSSIVVAPLLLAAGPYGGLYVTHSLPWDEGSGLTRGKAAIVALAGLLQRLLQHHVVGQHNKTWQELCEVSKGDCCVLWGFVVGDQALIAFTCWGEAAPIVLE